MEIKINKIVKNAEEVFGRFKQRYDIESGLQDEGFKLWAICKHEVTGKDVSDEQFWVYDNPTSVPNGQVIVFISWIGGHYWIYKKHGRGNL